MNQCTTWQLWEQRKQCSSRQETLSPSCRPQQRESLHWHLWCAETKGQTELRKHVLNWYQNKNDLCDINKIDVSNLNDTDSTCILYEKRKWSFVKDFRLILFNIVLLMQEQVIPVLRTNLHKGQCQTLGLHADYCCLCVYFFHPVWHLALPLLHNLKLYNNLRTYFLQCHTFCATISTGVFDYKWVVF